MNASTKRIIVSLAIMMAAAAVAIAENPAPAEEPAPGAPGPNALRQEVTLPGVVINLAERCVDVEAVVCLREGALELVACTANSKEHESIVAIEGKAMHVHTALLLVGAESGNPAMRKPVDEAEGHWIEVVPHGGRVEVFLAIRNDDGVLVERPIRDFIVGTGGPRGEDEEERFPTNPFLFAGSHLHGEGTGPRHYLADQSGNVISLATFGDEMLCLPGVHGHENGALAWKIDPTHLPALGSKVILRLRPVVKATPRKDDPR